NRLRELRRQSGPQRGSVQPARSGSGTVRWTALLCFLLLAGGARADEKWAWDALGLGGSVRTGDWSSDRSLDSLTNFAPTSIWLQARPKLPDGFYAGAEGWALDETSFHSGNRVRADLREGYAGWRNDAFDFSIGRTLVSWGRADQINPTDII